MIPFLHWLADYVSQYNLNYILVNLKEWYLFNSNNWSKCADACVIPKSELSLQKWYLCKTLIWTLLVGITLHEQIHILCKILKINISKKIPDN